MASPGATAVQPAAETTPSADVVPATAAVPSTPPHDVATRKDGAADIWPVRTRLWGENLDANKSRDNASVAEHHCVRPTSATSATPTSGEHSWQLPDETFEQQWTARYLSLWRPAPEHSERVFEASESHTAGPWLNDQPKAMWASGKLAPIADSISVRLQQFQKQFGLPVDGSALPLVFVHMNHLAVLNETHLAAGV
jgi:hypothetical protein